jgi:D-threonine aldolase
MSVPWHRVANIDEVPSPALLVYPERLEQNIRRMLALCPPERLRPHVKTHKLPEVVRMQMAQGIDRFKCATLMELEMAANAGASDLLLACQPVGPTAAGLVEIVRRFPAVHFSAIADDLQVIHDLSQRFSAAQKNLALLLDLDCGMHRSGIVPGTEALELYRLLDTLPGLEPGGLHVYDGHLKETDLEQRARSCAEAWAPVERFIEELTRAGLPIPGIVAGGTPTFPIHALRETVECSPGTCLLWDFGYARQFPDLDFLFAALVMTRVVSKPHGNRLCLDLGHKAIASENPHPRVDFIDLPGADAVMHSEEHLVIETDQAQNFPVGAVLYGIPRHVCPTCALYSEAVTVRHNRAQQRWKIKGRDRISSIAPW